MCVCIYTHKYKHTYIYVYIYIHVYILWHTFCRLSYILEYPFENRYI